MDKLKYIKLENEDGLYSSPIPLAVDSDHVDVDGTNLTDVLASKANTNEIDNLQNEINSLASGSPLVASSTSEMIDTSKVYVNTTNGHWYWYNGTAWEDGGVYQATEDSDTVNKLEIVKMDKTAEKVTLVATTTSVGAKNVNGSITENPANTFKTYDVGGIEIAYINGRNHYASSPLVLFYNSEMTLLSYINTETDNEVVTDYEVNIPSSCKYMIVNGRTSTPAEAIPNAYKYIYKDFEASFNELFNSKNIINDLNKKMNKTIGKVEIEAASSSLGAKHINGSVVENPANTFKTYDVEGIEIAYINGRNITNSYPLVLFYNNQMTLLSYISTGNNDETINNYEVNIPANCRYMIVNGRTSTPVGAISKAFKDDYIDFTQSVTNYLNDLNETNENTPLKNSIENGGQCAIFPKIACIGDSLTKGGMEWDTHGTGIMDYTQYSYPTQMQRVLNVTVYNMGSSGACASPVAHESQYADWNYRATQEGWLTNDYKAYCYIIALGTNDIGYGGSFTGDISTDIDDSDYNNNAQTSVGGYAKIIQRIKELQPRAKIFCVTIPNTRNSDVTRTEANTKIKTIAEHFNCFIIDLETYGVQKLEVASWKAIYYNKGHLNCMGYKELSNMILKYIDYIIIHNPRSFYDVPAIETDYE